MTRTREMQIQQLEMQGRKRRGRPPGSKNKPKSDVSGGLEIREFFLPCCACTVGYMFAGEACSRQAATMLTPVRTQAGVKMPRMGQRLLCMFPVHCSLL